MKTKSINQTVTFDTTPEIIYNLLMDQKKVAAFTGSKVTMSTKVNGKFNVFDGYCHGYNMELIESKKIVQAWHFAEDGWPDDHFSICTFELEKAGNKTKLKFLQTGVPEHKVDSLKDGWKQFYWGAIKEYLKTS
jgi:activator of HSP90 ATPase